MTQLRIYKSERRNVKSPPRLYSTFDVKFRAADCMHVSNPIRRQRSPVIAVAVKP